MEPRHEQLHDRRVIRNGGSRTFLGYVEEFDVYISDYIPEYDGDAQPTLTLVGPTDVYRETNYDCFAVASRGIRPLPSVDLNVTLYHMCLLYALCIEHGLLKGEPNET